MWSFGATLFELHTGVQLLAPSLNPEIIDQKMDYLHLIAQNMGKGLSKKFVSSAPLSARVCFEIDDSGKLLMENGFCKLIEPPSEYIEGDMRNDEEIAQNYSGMPLWQACIHYATEERGWGLSDSESLIAFIGPMLALEENRITPDFALELFFTPRPREIFMGQPVVLSQTRKRERENNTNSSAKRLSLTKKMAPTNNRALAVKVSAPALK
jgi:hypothetical protein